MVVGGGVLGVCGGVMVMQPDPAPSASERTRIKEMTKSFIFVFFIANYILAYQQSGWKYQPPLRIGGEGAGGDRVNKGCLYAEGTSGSDASASFIFSSGNA